jgi:hypothetical protein
LPAPDALRYYKLSGKRIPEAGGFMAAAIIDGKRLAEELRGQAEKRTADLAKKGGVPGLAVILVGEDPGSVSYVTSKEKACAQAAA